MTDGGADEAEFGPGGYLPPRAAKRARKIVLREQMGVHWPIAAVVAGVLILAITIPLVVAAQGPPGPPFEPAGPLDAIDPTGDGVVTVAGGPVLVLRAEGVLRAFADPPDGARWCPASRRIEAPGGRVWTSQGRLAGGTAAGGSGGSLATLPIQVVDGTLYVDPTSPGSPLPPVGDDAEPAC